MPPKGALRDGARGQRVADGHVGVVPARRVEQWGEVVELSVCRERRLVHLPVTGVVDEVRRVTGDEPGLQLAGDVDGGMVVDGEVGPPLLEQRLVDLGGIRIRKAAVEDVDLHLAVLGDAKRIVIADIALGGAAVVVVASRGTAGEEPATRTGRHTGEGNLLQESPTSRCSAGDGALDGARHAVSFFCCSVTSPPHVGHASAGGVCQDIGICRNGRM